MQITLLDPTELFRIVYHFDILAAVVFAVSGALVASRKNLDVMGFMWSSVITGVGGGTVRDVILKVPVLGSESSVRVGMSGNRGRDALRGTACRITVQDPSLV